MRVDPIRNMKDINAIKKLLHDNPRDLMLFTVSINSGIRCGDLLKLKIKDVLGIKVGEKIIIIEGKTHKTNYIYINNEIFKVIQGYLNSLEKINPEHYLFKSRKGLNYPISIYYVGLLVKKWCEAINLKGNFGAHSLRKSFCTLQRTKFHVPIEIISKRLNHVTPSVTRRYVGIIESEVEDILKHEIWFSPSVE